MGCANKAQVTHWSVLPVISQVLDSATHFDGLNVPSGKRTKLRVHLRTHIRFEAWLAERHIDRGGCHQGSKVCLATTQLSRRHVWQESSPPSRKGRGLRRKTTANMTQLKQPPVRTNTKILER